MNEEQIWVLRDPHGIMDSCSMNRGGVFVRLVELAGGYVMNHPPVDLLAPYRANGYTLALEPHARPVDAADIEFIEPEEVAE